VLQSRDVPREGFGMRQEKNEKVKSAGVLHVRHARHRTPRLLSLEAGMNSARLEAALNFGDCIDDEQNENPWRPVRYGCGRYAVFQPRGPSSFDQRFFDKVMTSSHPLRSVPAMQRPFFARSAIFVERSKRLLHLCCCENANRLERFGPRAIDCNLVRAGADDSNANERWNAFELSIWLTLEASAPQPVA